MSRIVKWGILGLGNIAYEFAKSFYNTNNAKLIAVASRSSDKLNTFKKDFKIKDEFLFSNYEELINNKEIDIVYIALPNNLHYRWISKSLDIKKNIFVEKPSFINFEECKLVFEHKNFKEIFFGEGFMYRYHPQLLKVSEIINNKVIGNLISMKSDFGKNLIYKKNFFGFLKKKIDKNKRHFNNELGGGVIFDQGCYPLSMSIFIASLIKDVNYEYFETKGIKKTYEFNDLDIESSIDIIFDKKFTSQISASFKNNLGSKTVIIGDEGQIIIKNSWNPNVGEIEVINNNQKKYNFKNVKSIYSLEIENISNDILENRREASFPGVNKKEIFINSKLINEWANEK